MAKTVGQIRYYGDGSPKNYPEGLSKSSLQYGLFFNNLVPITQLGVQSFPGAEILLNSHQGSSGSIIIGQTGIYELNLQGSSHINQLRVGVNTLNLINNNKTGYLIIDYISEREG